MKRLLLVTGLLFAALRPVHATELSPLLSTMNADNVTLYPGLLTYPSGGFHPEGVIYNLPAPVATAAGTGAQTLGTFSLPANAFDIAGRRVLVLAAITTAANTNTKTCTLNFGSESISTGAMATSGETSTMSLVATKTAASVQTVYANAIINTTNIKPVVTTGAETDTAAIVIAAICTDGTNSAGDATLQDFWVEYMN